MARMTRSGRRGRLTGDSTLRGIMPSSATHLGNIFHPKSPLMRRHALCTTEI